MVVPVGRELCARWGVDEVGDVGGSGVSQSGEARELSALVTKMAQHDDVWLLQSGEARELLAPGTEMAPHDDLGV